MVLTFATAGLQAQNQPEVQSPAQQNAPAGNQGPAPTAFPTPSTTGPLQAPPPNTFEAGPFGELKFNCLVSGMGLWQGNPVLSDNSANGAPDSVKLFLQKTTSWWQFYVITGAYNIPALGTPFISTREDRVRLLWSGPCRLCEVRADEINVDHGWFAPYANGG